MSKKNFDVLIIGVGTAGQVVAYNSKEAGLSVGIIDNRPPGGTCALRGCDPKKVLVSAAEAIDWYQRLSQLGTIEGKVKIDWPKLAKFKQSFVASVSEYVEKGLKNAGIKFFKGSAKFIDENSLTVDGQILKAKNIVIATGAVPTKLNIPGEQFVTISDDFLDLKKLPKKIIYIGGGYISFEFAHVTKRAGADVKILHRSGKLLPNFDQDLVEMLVKASRDIGIDIHTNEPVVKVEKNGAGFKVHTNSTQYDADLVVHGGGRDAALADLNLEKIKVEYDRKGVKVNEFLQTIKYPNIYAAGDASSYGLPLTPVADKEGLVVSKNIIGKEKVKADFKAIPSVVFTIPPLASVGLTEDQAKEKGVNFETKSADTSSWYSSRRINEKFSYFKTIIEKNTHKILGAHLLGENSEELINLFALAIKFNLTAEDLSKLPYAYPTHTSNIVYMV